MKIEESLTTPTANDEEQDSQNLQQQILHLKKENERLATHVDKLAFAVADKDKKIAVLQQYEHGFRKVNEQKASLEAAHRECRNRITALLTENGQQRLVQEELLRARKERQEALDEAAVLYAQFDVLKAMHADAEEKASQSARTCLETEQEVAGLKSRICQLENCRMQLESLQEKEAQYAKALEEVEEARHLLQANQRLQEQCQEADVRLRVAQHHLAKKVKETSELNDKMRALEVRQQELQAELDTANKRCNEQQVILDGCLQLEKRLQGQLQESARSADVAAAKWEEKYFKVYEKWQENELRIKELKKLEEKYGQMQALLTNFGAILGGTVTGGSGAFPSIPVPWISSEVASAFQHQPVADERISVQGTGHMDIHEELEERHITRPYQNLFDITRQPKRFKDNLFD